MKRFPLFSLGMLVLLFSQSAFSQKLIGLIDVGGQPAQLAVNLVTNMIYVTNTTTNSLVVVDGGSNKTVTSIALASSPFGVAVNPTTNMVYVTTNGSSNSVVVIDGTLNTIVATVTVSSPGVIAVNPSTNLIYFSSLSASLSTLDGSSNQVVNTIKTAYAIQGIAVNQATNRVYLSETTFPHEQVVVVDGNTGHVSAFQIPGACFLTFIAADSVLNRIYVVDNNCGGLYVIGGEGNRLLATVLKPGYYGPMTVDSTSHLAADFGGTSAPILSFLSTRTDEIVGNLDFPRSGKGAIWMAANNTSNRYYVSYSNSNEVAVISGLPATRRAK